MNQNNDLLNQNYGMPPSGQMNSGPQTQYSLDGMMGGGAPSGHNFLDQMSGVGMMGGQVNADQIILNELSELDSERF